jgi:type IV secretory pathway VirB10-like protein
MAKFRPGRYTLAMKMIPRFLIALLACTSFSAFAQWQWVDKDGRKVFSDRPPPSDVQDKFILKRPGSKLPAVPAAPKEAEPEQNAVAAPPALPSSARSTGIDKELEAKKKQATEAESAKRKAEEERVASAKAENCARAKQAKATYDSGVRVARTNAAGEREFLDDGARDAEVKRIQAVIASDCR